MSKFRVVAFALLIAAVCGTSAGAAGGKPQIWFAPMDPVPRPEVARGPTDYMQLFAPGAPWREAAGDVAVFQVYGQFIRSGSDADLTTVFRWLDQHNIALALETGLLHERTSCRRTEGFDSDQSALAERIRRLGGKLRYMTADEPLYFGHAYDEPGTCRLPIPEAAADAAASARKFQAVFPEVEIIETEPISNFKEPHWVEDIGAFVAAFRQSFGQPIAAVRLDIAWWEPGWEQRARAITSHLRGIGQPIGVIYNGNPQDASDTAWISHASDHYRAYEGLVGGAPDQAVFQSWMPHPARLLPETSAAAFTSLILDYRRDHPR